MTNSKYKTLINDPEQTQTVKAVTDFKKKIFLLNKINQISHYKVKPLMLFNH